MSKTDNPLVIYDEQPMSRHGNCWDNAPQESFFGHMKDELADKIPTWTCFDDVKADIDDWIRPLSDEDEYDLDLVTVL